MSVLDYLCNQQEEGQIDIEYTFMSLAINIQASHSKILLLHHSTFERVSKLACGTILTFLNVTPCLMLHQP